MSLAQQLWQQNRTLIQASLEHPFVQGIKDGSLPQATFAYYVGQDAFFLEAFARAYSIAAAKAPTWRGFAVFHQLVDGVLEELKLHQQYAQQWQVDLQTVEPGTATRRYTDFLFTTAWSQTLGVTAAAMSPCMSLYAYLGQQLAQAGMPQHAYSDWIQTYSSAEFATLAQQLDQLLDEYGSDSDAERSAYRYAMLCERDFFQAAWQTG